MTSLLKIKGKFAKRGIEPAQKYFPEPDSQPPDTDDEFPFWEDEDTVLDGDSGSDMECPRSPLSKFSGDEDPLPEFGDGKLDLGGDDTKFYEVDLFGDGTPKPAKKMFEVNTVFGHDDEGIIQTPFLGDDGDTVVIDDEDTWVLGQEPPPEERLSEVQRHVANTQLFKSEQLRRSNAAFFES